MASPRVSVICIFYDAERFLAEALDSVLAQGFSDFELLLVDDGSRDGSSAIARGYAERDPARVSYLQHPDQQNHGMSMARNLGLKHARGEFVAFIDADDVWRPGKLGEQVAILEANPDAGMVCGQVNYWSSWEGGKDRLVPTGHARNALSRPPGTLLAIYPLGHGHAPCPSDVMLRREAVEAVGGFEAQFTGAYEDVAFFGKLYLAEPVYFSTSVWLDYRQHEASSVAMMRSEGRYADVRRFFLDWFEDYLAGRDVVGKERIQRALGKARWAADHPVAARLLRRGKRIASSFRKRP